MEQLILLLVHWLRKRGVNPKGVRVIIEFPSEFEAQEASAQVRHELEPRLAFGLLEQAPTMHGIGLVIRAASPRS